MVQWSPSGERSKGALVLCRASKTEYDLVYDWWDWRLMASFVGARFAH
jgi:hypothetical protein